MKTTSNFYQLALASLVVLTLGAVTTRAQSAEGKVISAPSPVTQASPLPVPAKPVADKLAPKGWTRYEIGEPPRLSLILPAEPGASVERTNLTPKIAVTVRTYISSADSGIYGASYIDDLPASIMNEAMRRTFFQSYVKGFAEGFQNGMKEKGITTQLKMLEERPAKASGLAGYEQDFSFETLTGRVRLVFDGERAYAVLSFWNALSSNSERSTFFDSLQVNPQR